VTEHDTTVWRELGDPLVAGTPGGPLSGSTVAVKDLYDVAGHPCGAGNPAWLAAASPATDHAPVVASLLAAGADVRGITQTDEFAYSLYGVNDHYGTPPNPTAPGRVPGGSSSGSAAAVALGEVTVGLGTDTGGSIRVPAAYQGLFGIRTTHGLLPREGLLPLAPTFDAVGWMTRDAETLARVGDVLLGGRGAPHLGGRGARSGERHETETPALIAVPELLALAEPDVAATVADWIPATATEEHWDLSDLPDWREAFIVLQAWEAWQAHGSWLEGRLDTPWGRTCAAGSSARGGSRPRRPTRLARRSTRRAVRSATSSPTGSSCCPPRPPSRRCSTRTSAGGCRSSGRRRSP
jgi:Asp-tRNA(Asn)/Glu-tRNA(Gln) amidotransferase A subunit family amidase